jgi:hypothetical protein
MVFSYAIGMTEKEKVLESHRPGSLTNVQCDIDKISSISELKWGQ